MKITDDILKALQRTVEGFGSPAEFADEAEVDIKSLKHYLSKKTKFIKQETWEKIYPFLQLYLSGPANSKGMHLTGHLNCDQKILLDAFQELPSKLQEKKLIEVVELAREAISKKKS